MTIYYDQSEGRANTRLPTEILEVGHAVVGLEPATGADILVSPKDGLPGNVNRPPGKVLLPQFVEHGFLVQRKSGSDLLNSIPNLHNILWRMRNIADDRHARCWLMFCGEMRAANDGTVIMEHRDTGWKWQHVQSALEAWQLLGGFLSMQPTDADCAETILRWDRNIDKWVRDEERGMVQKPDIPKLDWDPRKWRQTLMTFPNCGDVMSDRIAVHTGRLVDALVWMSETDSFGVSGVGKKSLEGFRRYLGIKEAEHLIIINDEPTVRAESDGTS